MVLCFVTLTDLQTRRAGLSASAELLIPLGIAVARIIASCFELNCFLCICASQLLDDAIIQMLLCIHCRLNCNKVKYILHGIMVEFRLVVRFTAS